MSEGMGDGPMRDHVWSDLRRRGRLRRADDASAGVVSIMLALLTMIILITMVTTLWMPEWMQTAESDHMKEVNAQFAKLKSSIDKVVLSGDTKFVIGNPITLGTQSTSVFGTDAAGTFEINNFRDDDLEFYCNIKNASGEVNITCTGAMKYTSDNAQYVDQTLAYENGALVLNQGKGQVVRARPQFIIEKHGPVAHMTYVLITVSGVEASVTGMGTIIVQTQLVTYTKASFDYKVPEWMYITMVSEFSEAWGVYYTNTLIEEGFTPGVDFTLTVTGSKVSLAIRNVASFDMGYALINIQIQDSAGGSISNPSLSDVLGLWHLNEGTGGIAGDSGPLHNPGSVGGDINWTNGVQGPAFHFNGSNRISVPDIPEYNVEEGITVMVWVRWTINPWNGTGYATIASAGENQWTLMHNGNTTGSTHTNDAFEFSVRTNETRDWVWSHSVPGPNIWYHVTGVFSSAESAVKIYINGTLENTTVLNGTINTVNQELTFGAQYHSGSHRRYLEGDVDEIYIFDRALTDSEISRYYQMLKP